MNALHDAPAAGSKVSADWLTMIDALSDGVLLVDALRLDVVAANRAAGVLFGVAAAALIGRAASDLGATPEDEAFWQGVSTDIAGSIASDSLLHRADGAVVAVERRVDRVQLAQQALYVVALHDRSEEVRTARDLAITASECRATLESLADGVLVSDLAGRIRNFNRRFALLWQLPDELLLQRDDAGVHSWLCRSVADPAAYQRRLAELDAAPLLGASDKLVLRWGAAVERIVAPQLSHGRPIGRIATYRDITGSLHHR